ncbi:hypothetical protein LPTSP1_36760 [Leptospira johnsonii]|uniref:Uncharacterized protein n=1 Tax=Leptospira johnsonii TaxID=1917820 RepID=A0A2P2D7S1_9LEPT|nr:hypothetical protein LPTSP1_36760 [Leptospira johnsonii]
MSEQCKWTFEGKEDNGQMTFETDCGYTPWVWPIYWEDYMYCPFCAREIYE